MTKNATAANSKTLLWGLTPAVSFQNILYLGAWPQHLVLGPGPRGELHLLIEVLALFFVGEVRDEGLDGLLQNTK